jgi:hypothetical protein
VEFLSQGKEMAFMRELDFRMGFFLSIWSGPLEVLNLLILPEISNGDVIILKNTT